ncbi:MAG: universal stress protein [Deltaproteobacteria bacterium]|nr:universal stress protein [Deltaproteobacteria bacterium]
MTEPPSALGLKRLLVATDFSPRADVAMRRAVQIVSEHGAALTLFHVSDPDARDDALARQLALDAEETLRRKIRALSLPDNAAATVRVATGKPFVEIIRRARQERVELVIVGAHGQHFWKDLLLGTTAEKVARKGDRPVLVVKRAPRGPYRRVLVPVDFSDHSRRALELALQLAPRAQFHVLHVYQGFEAQLRRAGLPVSEMVRHQRPLAKEARQEIDAFLGTIDHRGKPIRREVWNGRAHHEITRVARRLHADLVAVGTTGRTGLPYILLGSVAEHVLRELSCDVLVARAGSARFKLP